MPSRFDQNPVPDSWFTDNLRKTAREQFLIGLFLGALGASGLWLLVLSTR